VIEFFSTIFNTLIDLFPHLKKVLVTQGGIKFRRGSEVTVLTPGLHWYWPLISTIKVITVVRDTMDLNGQTFTTKDGKVILASGMVVFSINDVEKVLTSSDDYINTLCDICMNVIHDTFIKYEWEHLRAGILDGSVGKELRRNASEELRPFGIKVISLGLKDLAPVRVFKLVQDS